MKMLKRLFQFSRTRREARGKPQTTPQATPQATPQLYSAITNDEFARLLASGRLEDLKILAERLSGTSRVKT